MNHGSKAESRNPTTPRLVNKWGPKFLVGYLTGLASFLIVGGAASFAMARLSGAKDLWEAVTGEELIFLGIGCITACVPAGAVATVGPGTTHFSDLSVRRTALKIAAGGLIVGLACVGLAVVVALGIDAKTLGIVLPFFGALLGPPLGWVLQYGSVMGLWHKELRTPRE